MTTTVTSFNGTALQSSDIDAHFESADNPFGRTSSTTLYRKPTSAPSYVRGEPSEAQAILHINVRSAPLQTQQDILGGIFPVGATGDLVVDFGGSSRRVSASVVSIAPYADGAPNRYTVTLVVPEPRWRSAALQTDALASVTTPDTITLANDGKVNEDALVFTVRPRTQKPGSNAWRFVAESIIANREPRTFSSYAIDVTGGGWAHSTETAAGRSQADGDDVRVLVDGIQTPRWDGEAAGTAWNTAGTQVWITLTMSPAQSAQVVGYNGLIANLPIGALTSVDVAKGDTAGWPDSGALLIEDEVITYTAKTDHSFTGIARGARNTTDATHAVSPELTVYWIERRVQIVYGNSSATAPPADDNLKPMIDLSVSTNTLHVWNDFTNEIKPRPMQWSLVQDLARDRQADHMAGKVSGASSGGDLPGLRLEYYQDPSKHNERPGNVWQRDFPAPVSSVDFLYTNSAFQAVGLLLAIDDTGKERVVTEMKNGSSTALGATAIQNATRLGIYGRLFTAIQSYAAAAVAADIVLSTAATPLVSTIAVPAHDYYEPITVPELVRPQAFIEELILTLKQQTGVGNRDADVSLAILIPGADPTLVASYQDVSAVKTINITGTAFATYRFTWTASETVSVRPDDVVYIHVARGASGTASHSIVWQGGYVLYAGQSHARTFDALSLSLDQSDFVLGGDGIFFSVDRVAATLASSTVPYVSLKSRQDIYYLNAVLTNGATGQSVTFAAFLALDAYLEIDVGNRRVRNLTTGDDMLYAATFSDPVAWLTLQPGSNLLTITEADIVSVDYAFSWSDRWA